MTAFRRFAPIVAILLAALVAVQTTDIIACADEATPVGRTDGYHVDGKSAVGAHPSPVPGDDHDDGAPHEETPGIADCLCHVIFVPMTMPTEIGVPAAMDFDYPGYLASSQEGNVRPPGPVPIG